MSHKPWPHPEDTTTAARAKRIANTALYFLGRTDPDTAYSLMVDMHEHGETWFGTALVTHEPTDAITTAEAATLLGVAETTIRKWASTPHPNPRRAKLGQMLLPRFARRGRAQTYLVKDLRQAEREYRRLKQGSRHARHGGNATPT